MTTKSDKTPRGYVNSRSRKATHWIVWRHTEVGDMRSKRPTVACGQPLGPDDLGRWVAASENVTCWACAKIAKADGFAIHEPGKERDLT